MTAFTEVCFNVAACKCAANLSHQLTVDIRTALCRYDIVACCSCNWIIRICNNHHQQIIILITQARCCTVDSILVGRCRVSLNNSCPLVRLSSVAVTTVNFARLLHYLSAAIAMNFPRDGARWNCAQAGRVGIGLGLKGVLTATIAINDINYFCSHHQCRSRLEALEFAKCLAQK